MSTKLRWTEATDTRIRQLRAAGASWNAVAAAIGTGRWSAIERGRRIGARAPIHVAPPPPDPAREALPAGHPLTWGAITAGTLLEATAYPWPPLPPLPLPRVRAE
jgi:peptidoglycan/xylan/chitin deacetylase (PgdA/CDA1 family)